MALDPRIALETRVPDVGRTFQNFLMNVNAGKEQRRQNELQPLRNRLLEAQVGTAEAQQTEQQQQNKIRSLANLGVGVADQINRGASLQDIRNGMDRRVRGLVDQGLPTTDSEEVIGIIDNPNFTETEKMQQIGQLSQQAIQMGQNFGVLPKAQAGLASAKTDIRPDGTVVQVLPSGQTQVLAPDGTPVTGKARLDVLAASDKAVQTTAQLTADRAVDTARRKARVVNREARNSEIFKEQGGRVRDAKRSMVKLNEASVLVDKATQGITGSLKLRLGKTFPGIDVSDESALAAAFKGLALEQLNQFKGQTTDFEFRITEDIAGSLGDGASANRARINSLRRNNWFIRRESEQFRKHADAGFAPAEFEFDFNEKIPATGREQGFITLKDLQETAAHNHLSIEETLKRFNQ